MADEFDAIVIGSGFGGAVAACRLAGAGYKVLVLERGRRWHKEEYPSVSGSDWMWSEDNPAKENGWLDIRLFGSIGTVAGSGVGGGSLHYANVSINAQPDLFSEGWPPEITYQDLEQNYYSRVDKMLKPEKVPENQLSNRALLVKEAAKKAGYEAQYDRVDLAVTFDPDYTWDASKKPDPDDSKIFENDEKIEQGTCVHLGACVGGCPVEARNTLALNYIPNAEKNGAEVRTLHIVRSIVPVDKGYRVFFDRIEKGRLIHGWAAARIVVVAAGTIGSNELLLRCRKQFRTLPAISSQLGNG
jgi:cholesterol oxidase